MENLRTLWSELMALYNGLNGEVGRRASPSLQSTIQANALSASRRVLDVGRDHTVITKAAVVPRVKELQKAVALYVRSISPVSSQNALINSAVLQATRSILTEQIAPLIIAVISGIGGQPFDLEVPDAKGDDLGNSGKVVFRPPTRNGPSATAHALGGGKAQGGYGSNASLGTIPRQHQDSSSSVPSAQSVFAGQGSSGAVNTSGPVSAGAVRSTVPTSSAFSFAAKKQEEERKRREEEARIIEERKARGAGGGSRAGGYGTLRRDNQAAATTTTTTTTPAPVDNRLKQQQEEEERARKQREKEEADKRKREQDDADRRKREQDDADKRKREQDEAERRKRDQDEADRKKRQQQQEDDAKRVKRDQEDAERRKREQDEADRKKRQEQEEADRRQRDHDAQNKQKEQQDRERQEREKQQQQQQQQQEKEKQERERQQQQQQEKAAAAEEARRQKEEAAAEARRANEAQRIQAAAEKQKQREQEALKRIREAPATETTTTTSPSPAAAPAGRTGNAWEQRMQAKAEAEHEASRQVIRDRRAKAGKHVDEEIRKLISEIQRLSSSIGVPNPAGVAGLCPSIKFGELFARTQGSMSELAATLQTAKKRGVIEYEGYMLQQGYDDDKLITLVKDQIKDSEMFKSKIVKPAKPQAPQGPAPCNTCGKTVYLGPDRLLVNALIFHKACFKCSLCNRILKISEYSFVSNRYFCKPCFMKEFNRSGGLDFAK